jgi:hypothetical protein
VLLYTPQTGGKEAVQAREMVMPHKLSVRRLLKGAALSASK